MSGRFDRYLGVWSLQELVPAHREARDISFCANGKGTPFGSKTLPKGHCPMSSDQDGVVTGVCV